MAEVQNQSPPVAKRRARADRRTEARIAAVQALYQIDVTETSVDGVLTEFVSFRLGTKGRKVKGKSSSGADQGLFADIVKGVCKQKTQTDEIISSSLSDDWTLERMDRVVCAILRAGAYELFSRNDIPAKVVITEYVDVARAFFDPPEPGFVNGVLDRLARVLRANEFDAAAPGTAPQ
jgi:N utilization substance protein B